MTPARRELTPEDRRALSAESKVGIVATVDGAGAPHVTLITSLSAPAPRLLVFGEFCAGRSKAHLAAHPDAAWAVMTLDRRLYQGTARWKAVRRDGPELDQLNRQPMFRYNAYTGVYAVHYLDLRSVTGPDPLPVARLLAGTVAAQALRLAPAGRSSGDPPLRPWAVSLIDHPATLRFLAAVGEDGVPRLHPLVPAVTAGGRALRFVVLGEAWPAHLTPGTEVALFALNLQMQSVLVRGRLGSLRRLGPVAVGDLPVEWVYNSMPPLAGQVYPLPPLAPITVV